jgi:uncharacterized protein
MLKRAILLLLFFPLALFAYTSPGRPSGFVNDFTGTLSKEDINSLEVKLSKFEKDSSNEISVVLVNNLDGDNIENYAVQLFSDWGIGKRDNDNGVLLLIALQERKMRIEVGYGLEGALTDLQGNTIINNTLKPAFQQGDFYGGITRALEDIISATRGEYVGPIDQSYINGRDLEGYLNIFGYLVFGVLWLTSVLARSKNWWAGGVVGGIIGVIIGSIFGFFYIGLASLFFLIPAGLLLDFIVSRAYHQGRQTGYYPWWIGGGPHHNGFGGLFRGFGGGRSGGGGSSGDW